MSIVYILVTPSPTHGFVENISGDVDKPFWKKVRFGQSLSFINVYVYMYIYVSIYIYVFMFSQYPIIFVKMPRLESLRLPESGWATPQEPLIGNSRQWMGNNPHGAWLYQ